MSRTRSLPSALRALAHRDYRRWAAAGTLSVIGSWMQGAAQAWLLLQISGSGTMLGAGVALKALPSLFLAPWGGVIADRFPRRRVLLATQGGFVVLSLVEAALAVTGRLDVPILLACSLVAGLVATVDAPASAAFGATLVPDDDLVNAAALGSATNSLGRIVGMSSAGVVVAVAGPGLAFALNALSFVPVVVVLSRLRPTAVPSASGPVAPWQALREGLGFVVRTPQLCWLLGLAFVLGSLGRSYQVTMALMVEDVFGGGAAGYGAASTAFAVGALLGAIVAAHLRQVTGGVVLAAGGVGAVGELASGLAPGFTPFMLLMVLVAAAAVLLDTVVSTRVTLAAPDWLRGRVLAVAGAAGAGAGAVGGPALGAMGQALGARAPLVVGGVVCLVACAAAWRGVVGTEDRGPERGSTAQAPAVTGGVPVALDEVAPLAAA